MWRKKLWKKESQNFSSQGLWMDGDSSTQGCGEKRRTPLEEKQVIHIKFPYYACYYK